ncbi:hypothetical protein BJ322DRAFT_861509 [Thelephora terrestris]|uniref:F-box domain-containing protein n=1 Tax=Thelephora terrestris TaxID=56493 RepID=A0A9P6HDP5_9AGAM|nr:hypothetical protein BJ322DRAFT_861509 [Thelephora terrestris]
MFMRAARTLSMPELLQVLGEKLDEEYSTMREIPLSFALSAGSLEPEIENLETRAHEILRFLRCLRNRLPPVNRLPAEIISHIARCILELQEEFDAKPIVPLTHACQYWRNSIVSTPENWTRIFNGARGVAELSLERAKSAPLDVFLDLDSGKEFNYFDSDVGLDVDVTLDFLLPHAHNVAFLNCFGFASIELTKALPNFPKSMPNLRYLTLTGNGMDAQDRSRASDPFDFSTHTLRELSLEYFPLLPSFLSLRTLTKFELRGPCTNLHVDTILGFLERNRSLEHAIFCVDFEDSLRRSQRQTLAKTTLKSLLIYCYKGRDVKPLVSNLALRKGAALEILDFGSGGLTRLLSGISTNHLPGLSSPFSMEYQIFPRKIRLLCSDGSLSYTSSWTSDGHTPFGEEFPLLQLADVRELRLKFYGPCFFSQSPLLPFPPLYHLPSFPSLEILVIDGSIDDDSISSIGGPIKLSLSTMLPHLTSSPSLQTLAFLDCSITEDFMGELARVALDRKNHTSASLRRVVIVNSTGRFPPAGSVGRLKKCVSIVEVLEGKELPKDLSQSPKF